MTKYYISQVKDVIESKCNSISLDFVNDYEIEKNNSLYFSDIVSEYADGSISVYYTDQHNYYVEHSEECENALLNIMDSESIAEYIKNHGLYELTCYAGVCGQYEALTNELYEDEKRIYQLLFLKYIENNFQKFCKMTIEKLNSLLDEIELLNISTLDEILEVLE